MLLFADMTKPSETPSAAATSRPRKRSKKPTAPPDPTKPRTADIYKIVNFYLKNVRPHDKREIVGIYRQVLLMCAKGITLGQVSQAVQNYAANEFTRSCPPPQRKHIRRFMMPENIRAWAELTTTRDTSLAALAKLAEANTNTPEIPTWKVEDEPEEECTAEL